MMSGTTSIVLVSGLSGAGKSAVLHSLEDVGYYCVDNLPPALITTLADLCDRAGTAVQRAALVVDVRTHGLLDELAEVHAELRRRPAAVELVFLDADDSVLQQRFSETRRPHPLATQGDVGDGIRRERERLTPIRDLADRVIDTSHFTPHDLRELIAKLYGSASGEKAPINVVSFAFRSGLPKNADLVFDVRFLPNPNYVAELKPLTGLDNEVAEFVESSPETREFLNHIEGLLQFIVPRLGGEARAYLTLAFGCTGGRHRSVAIARHVAGWLEGSGYRVTVSHRDLPEGR
jgi:UPF0042 nucleotide-binding protein